MAFQEFEIIDLTLPQFIENFKQNLLNYLIPSIENLIAYFEKLKINEEESPILLFLGAIILVQIITAIIATTTKQKDDNIQNTEHRQLSKDLKDLKK
jgi:serine/threonine-protein kinase RIO1